MTFTTDNFSNTGVAYYYDALNALLAARMADGEDAGNASDAINNAMVERDDGIYVGDVKVGEFVADEE